MKHHLNTLYSNTLFRNSLHLMLATGVMAGFGFFFWLLVARLYHVSDIGYATTLISIMNMIAMLSLVGFDATFVRFLPTSTQKNDKINTGLVVVGVVAILLSTSFLSLVHVLSPALAFIAATPLTAIAFVFFSVMTALNILTDAIFLAERKTIYTLAINTIFSIVRLVLPLFLISWGALGIFSAVAISQTVGFALSLSALMLRFHFRPSFCVSKSVLLRVRGYSLNNYLAGVLNLLPPTILPILITNHIGPEQAAFYYIIMMIGNLMYTIPWATTKSLFAEGSHAEHTLRANSIHSAKIITILLLPAIGILYFFGSDILLMFGKTYSHEGFAFMQLIALSGIPVAAYSILGAYFKIKRDPRWMVLINTVYALSIICASIAWVDSGLVGIGNAWILGNIIASVVGVAIASSPRMKENTI